MLLQEIQTFELLSLASHQPNLSLIFVYDQEHIWIFIPELFLVLVFFSIDIKLEQ